MNTCKDCKYWGAMIPGACDAVDCIFSGVASVRFELELDALDDSGLTGMLMTGPDFGCIHFKEIPSESL